MGSDVGLMIIGSVDFGTVVDALHPAQQQLAREINPKVFCRFTRIWAFPSPSVWTAPGVKGGRKRKANCLSNRRPQCWTECWRCASIWTIATNETGPFVLYRDLIGWGVWRPPRRLGQRTSEERSASESRGVGPC